MDVDSKPVLFVLGVYARVESSVLPFVNSFAVHHVFVPLSAEGAAVGPVVNTVARDQIIEPIAYVRVAVGPAELSFAFFLAVFVHSLECTIVWPGFFSESCLLVREPFPFVLGSGGMLIDAIALSHVSHPFAIVNIFVDVEILSLSVGLVILPVSFVLGAIWPELNSVAMTETIFHLPCVFLTIFKDVVLSELESFFLTEKTFEVLPSAEASPSYQSFDACLHLDDFLHLFLIEADLAMELKVRHALVGLLGWQVELLLVLRATSTSVSHIN